MTKSLKNILEPIKSDLIKTKELITQSILGDSLFSTFADISLEGKKLRPALAILTHKMLSQKENLNLYNLASAIELIHIASLIHDDIIDDATQRRLAPSLNALKGNKTAVIAGDFILAKALNLLAKINNPNIISIFANSMENLCKGEILQKESLWQIPTLDNYIEKSKNKTANLFIAAMSSGAILSNSENKAIEEYALNFGIAFQVKDDLLNIETDLSDFKNGIFTLAAIFTIEEKPFLKDNLDNIKNEITQNAIIRTKEIVESYTNKAIKALESFEDSSYKQALIEIAKYNIERKS